MNKEINFSRGASVVFVFDCERRKISSKILETFCLKRSLFALKVNSLFESFLYICSVFDRRDEIVSKNKMCPLEELSKLFFKWISHFFFNCSMKSLVDWLYFVISISKFCISLYLSLRLPSFAFISSYKSFNDFSTVSFVYELRRGDFFSSTWLSFFDFSSEEMITSFSFISLFNVSIFSFNFRIIL